MKKTFIIIALTLFTAVPISHAVCPVCTVAVGAGLGLAEWLGIDDSISGLWIGGLTVSLIIWTINWLKVRLWGIPATELPEGKSRTLTGKLIVLGAGTIIGYYLLIVGPLWWKGYIGKNPFNRLCGIDKLLFGIILGTILFIAGVSVHNYLRKKNEEKSYFKGQKIVAAVTPLIIASVILYFTC